MKKKKDVKEKELAVKCKEGTIDLTLGKAKVTVNLVKIGRFTVAEAVGTDSGKKLISVGIARCSDLDSWKPAMGVNIAIGRALKAMERKVAGKKITQVLMG